MARTTYKALNQVADLEQNIARDNERRDNSNGLLNLRDFTNKSGRALERALSEFSASSGRQITAEDIKRFTKAYNEIRQQNEQDKTFGGIQARTLLNRSLRVDIDRSRSDVTVARPVSINAEGVCKFLVTSRGGNRHYVAIQFMNFGMAITSLKSTKKLVDMVVTGNLRYDCDCGRHRYWYRYIATVGGFNYGKPETAFPKVRNPQLRGIACKHVLKACLTVTKSVSFHNWMKTMIERYMKKPNSKDQIVTDKQAEEMAKRIQKEAFNKQKVRQTKKKYDKVPSITTLSKASQSIKGKRLKLTDLTKEIQKKKTEAQKRHDALAAIKNADLNGLSDAQIKAIQAILNKG